MGGVMTDLQRFFVSVFSLTAMSSASAKALPTYVRVRSAASQQFQGPPLATANCDYHDISAYCYSSKPKTYVENIMIVDEPDGKSLEIACTVYNRWSHCSTLPVNQTFQAWMGKHDLTIRYLDQRGKMRKQVYEILRENGKETS
jgi:hypothetical protein